MKLLTYPVSGVLYQPNSTVVAQVGDAVNLFLDVESDTAFPESVVGVIQNPITTDACRGTTTYVIEYDETELNDAVALLRPGHILYVTVASPLDAVLTELALKAPLASPTFTGTVVLPNSSRVGQATLSVSNLTSSRTFSFPDIPGEIFLDNSFGAFGLTLSQAATLEEALTSLGILIYADLTAANADLNAGQVYYDIALGTLNTATA